MNLVTLVTALALAINAPLPAPPAPAQDMPKISDEGWCVAYYSAMARARERRAKSPKRLFETAGFFSIDFTARAKAVRAKAKDQETAILLNQQVFEEAFDGVGYAEADGKAPAAELAEGVSIAILETLKCDKTHGFKPALLERIAQMPAPPTDPYSCAVNYWAVGLGMGSNPQAQRAMQSRIGASMARFDPQIAQDTVWRDIVRARIQADAAERNKAVGEGKVTPPNLFAHSQACDAMFAKPPG